MSEMSLTSREQTSSIIRKIDGLLFKLEGLIYNKCTASNNDSGMLNMSN